MPSFERTPVDLLVFCLVSLALLASAATAQLDLKAGLESICKDEADSANIIFTSPSQVLELIEMHESSPDICQTRKYDDAFRSMKSLLDQSVLEDVCSYQTYEKLRRFHLDFLHYYKPEFSRQELLEFDAKVASNSEATLGVNKSHIPEALRSFFILFAKQINSSCKQQIAPRLKELLDEKKLVSNDEFALMERYKRESRRLLPLGGSGLTAIKDGSKKRGVRGLLSNISIFKAKDLRDIEILDFELYEKENRITRDADLLGVSTTTSDKEEENNDDEGMKLYVQVKFNDRLKLIHDTCESKLRPIYEEVFGPVIRLNSLAYVDHLKSDHEDKQLESDENLTRWFNIIEACEIMKDVEVLHDSTPMAALVSIIKQSAPRRAGQDRSELNQVKLMSKGEADEFKARLPGAANEVDPVEVDHVRVKFTPRMWLTERKDIDRELQYHNKDLKKILANRRSYLNVLFNNVTYQLKSFFYKHKSEISDRDQTSQLGRLTAFAERHRMSIKMVMLLISVVFIALHFG